MAKKPSLKAALGRVQTKQSQILQAEKKEEVRRPTARTRVPASRLTRALVIHSEDQGSRISSPQKVQEQGQEDHAV